MGEDGHGHVTRVPPGRRCRTRHDGCGHRRGVRPQRRRASSRSRCDEAAIDRGRGHIEHSTARAVARGKLTADEQARSWSGSTAAPTSRRSPTSISSVEAVPEHLDLKRAIFAQLDEVCKPETILATNTSSLSVTEIAVATHRPGKVVGLHFFNPAPVMKLVEIVRSVRHRAGGRRRRRGFRPEARQGRRHDRRPGRVHRQRAAVRLPQPRGGDVRVALRHPRGHRRRR